MNRDTRNREDYILSNIPKEENIFSVPENYFDSLEDRVLSQIIEEQLPKKLPYTIPDTYFEEFEDRLFTNTEFSKKEVNVIRLKSRILKIIPVVAAASILLFIGFNYFTTIKPNSIDSVSSGDIELWMDENYVEYSTTNVMEFVDADFIERSFILEDDTSLEDEDILEYLHTIDTSSLLTEMES
jgi:hypothetical protein